MYHIHKPATSDNKYFAQSHSFKYYHFHSTVSLSSLCSKTFPILLYLLNQKQLYIYAEVLKRRLHTIATSEYMQNTMYRAQWPWLKPRTNRKPPVIIFRGTVIYYICSTPSKTYTAKLFNNSFQRSRAVHEMQNRILPL